MACPISVARRIVTILRSLHGNGWQCNATSCTNSSLQWLCQHGEHCISSDAVKFDEPCPGQGWVKVKEATVRVVGRARFIIRGMDGARLG
jgi:hypothetical protein